MMEKCTGGCNYYFSGHCGAYVCMDCGHHKSGVGPFLGLVRCHCEWAASSGDGRRELEEMGETIDPEPEYVVSGVVRRYT